MNFTQKFDTVCDKVFQDDLDKWDALVPSKDLVMQNGRLLFPDATADGYEFGLAPTPWAMGQICQRLSMPSAYFRSCPPFLQDAQFNPLDPGTRGNTARYARDCTKTNGAHWATEVARAMPA